MNEIIDFVAKSSGEPQNTKLGDFLGKSESAIRNLKKTDKKIFDCMYIGAFCEANHIKKDDLLLLLEIKKRLAKDS